MIKVITFDLDGVYFPNGKKNFMHKIVQLGVSEEEFKRVFAKSDEMNTQYKLGKMSDEAFWTWAATEWKLALPWTEFPTLLVESYDVDERIVNIIRTVREKGYKTAICTSNFPARIHGLHKKFGFLNDFDVTVISYEVGANKPDVAIYQTLVDKSGVKPEEIAFADDNADSVAASASVGITTFLYEDFETYLQQLRSAGVNM